MLCPSSLREKLRPDGRVHAAVDGPIEGITGDITLYRRVAVAWDQEPGLAGKFLQRVGSKREEEYGYTSHSEHTVVQDRVLANLHAYATRVELPLGMWQFTSRYSAMVHDVVGGSRFIHLLGGEGERVGTTQSQRTGFLLSADRADGVVKDTGFFVDVVGGMSGGNVLVVGCAVEHHMTVGGYLSVIVVVGGVIRPENQIAIMDLSLSIQFVDGSVSFLMLRQYEHRLSSASRGPLRRRLAGN